MKPTNPNIKIGLWTIVIELNNYSDSIIINSDDAQEVASIQSKYYGEENVDRIRIFDRDNDVNMYKEF